MIGGIVVVRTCTVLEQNRQLPRWFTILPIGAFLALLVMGLTHQNFKPSDAYLTLCVVATLVATVWLANHMRVHIVGCAYRPRFGGDLVIMSASRAWQQSLVVSLVCVLAVAFFMGSFCNTVFGKTRFSRYVVIGKYVEHQRFTSCNTLRIARQSVRLITARARHHVCVSAMVFDAVSPGAALMVGEQTSWFGKEFTSEQPILQ